MDLIKKYLKYSNSHKKELKENFGIESLLIKKHNTFRNFLVLFWGTANFTFYNAFLVGNYNFRDTELLSMRRIPKPFKVGISTLVSTYMTYKLWNMRIYNEDLYKYAVEKRHLFCGSPQPSASSEKV